MSKPQIHYIESTDSTMLEARRLAKKGVVSGTVVWSGFQTAGRGRINERRWESKPGDGLLFTVIFTKADIAKRMAGRSFTLLPLLCGLAVSGAVSKSLGNEADIRIKWPNDILAGGRKLCGILCEASGDWVYAGIGINLNQTEFPKGLRRPAVSLRMLKSGLFIDQGGGRSILELVLEELDSALENELWRQAVDRRLYRLGEIVRIKPGLPEELMVEPEVAEGRLTGVDSSGALLIETVDGILPVISGELLA